MRHPNKTDLRELRKMLNQLRKEAVHWGLPRAHVAYIDDLEKIMKRLEEVRGE